jgi:multiple sugar transport system substrate-binding protein
MVGYRKDLFSDASERHAFKAKYGYDLAPPRTYKALLDIARFFTRRKGQTLAGKPLDEDFYGTVVASKKGFVFSRYMDILVGFGANLLYDAKTMRPSWNSPESVSALKYYVDLYKTMPADAQTMTGGMSARFAAGGRSATIVHFLDLMYSSFEDPKASKVVGKFGYVLLPTQVASRPHATAADANGIGVYALSEHKAEAFKLLANTLSADGIKAAVLKYYPEFPSMRRSILNDPQVIRTRPALYRAMGLITSEKVYLFALPEIREWAQLVDVASDSILEAATGQKSVEQAASEGQNRMVDIFKRAGYIK